MRRAFDGTYPITRDFGVYDSAYSSYPNSLHPGTDYGLPFRTPLYAGFIGTLSSFDRDRTIKTGRGKEIVITNGMKTRKYCHLDEIVVHDGFVTEGQLVGYSGYTGYVMDSKGNIGTKEGTHLHDELLINGVYVPLETNLTEEDMITKEDVDLVRIINSEVQGYDFDATHSGQFDQVEMNAWTGQPIDKLIREKWSKGESFRNSRKELQTKVSELSRVVSIKDNEIARLNALVGESTKWQTLRTLLRELLGIK